MCFFYTVYREQLICISIFKNALFWLLRDIIFCSVLRLNSACMYFASTTVYVPSPFFKSIRLLDVSALSTSSGLDLTMVLEYIDQDLSTYLSAAPASGLSRHTIKVSTLTKLQRHINTGFNVCLKDILIFKPSTEKHAHQHREKKM